MELLEDVMTLALVVSIQLGVPVTVLFVIGYLRHRDALSRGEPRRGHLVAAGVGGVGGLPALPAIEGDRPCWEVKRCSPEEIHACAALQRSGMACWQATRTPFGHLRAKCVKCDRFLATPGRGSRR